MRSTTLLVLGLTLGSALGGAACVHAAADTRGFLYGTITTESGQVHEGRLRWGTEESFWGDLFNSSKAELARRDEVPGDQRERRHTLNLFGFEIDLTHHGDSGRQFIVPFGDIDRIEVTGRDDAVVVLKSGRRVEVEGGSNDLGGDTKIAVWDASLGQVELEWRKIDRIQFRPAPRDLPVADHRLYGVVRTEGGGDFRGWIQWDQDECLSTDELDGETEDGDLEIPMGNIRTIEPRGRRSSRVVLRDGRELELRGTNDVDSDNRGIFVEDERFARVLVSWDAFERAEFSDPPGSGPAYGTFTAGKPLRGTVTTRAGRKLTGRLVYDLDEEGTAELLGGERRGIEYYIPFAMIASVTPTGSDRSRIELVNGEKLELEGGADIGKGNAGILVLAKGKRPAYVPWEEVERIVFGR
jgi:hypothetical protein